MTLSSEMAEQGLHPRQAQGPARGADLSPGPMLARSLTHVGGDDDEGPQVGPPHVLRHVAEVGLEAPQQLCRAPLAPLDLLPGGAGGRGQEGAARVDDVLVRRTDGWHSAPVCGQPQSPG